MVIFVIMFSLLYGLWQYVFKKDDYFVLILGLDNSGKTTFLEHTKINFNKRYKGVNLSRITSTVGLNVGSIDMPSGVRLIFWDLGGQKELRTLWDKYFSECHGVIYVIDSADESRVPEVRENLEEVLKHDRISKKPILV